MTTTKAMMALAMVTMRSLNCRVDTCCCNLWILIHMLSSGTSRNDMKSKLSISSKLIRTNPVQIFSSAKFNLVILEESKRGLVQRAKSHICQKKRDPAIRASVCSLRWFYESEKKEARDHVVSSLVDILRKGSWFYFPLSPVIQLLSPTHDADTILKMMPFLCPPFTQRDSSEIAERHKNK